MARHRTAPQDNNWARLGDLIIDYWEGNLTQAQITTDPRGVLGTYGCHIDPQVAIHVYFDDDDNVHIGIPHHAYWSGDELDVIKKCEQYRRELGIVVMGGCR